MSELINNSEKRKELLKHMILQLHKGKSADAVRAQLLKMLGAIPYGEVVEVEQELIAEGLPQEEVIKLCDVHSEALKGVVDKDTGIEDVPAGHPVHTFIEENRALQLEIAQTQTLFKKLSDIEMEDFLNELHQHVNILADVEKHYRRKENLVFPYLEQKGVTGPPAVMWGKHDEIRDQLKAAKEAVHGTESAEKSEWQTVIDLVFQPLLTAIEEMVYKEEQILFPMCMEKFTTQEWYEIYKQSVEIGFCLYDPKESWEPEDVHAEETIPGETGRIQLPSGSFSLEELTILLNTLPVDITFVDKDDKVKYFTRGKERIFDRTRAILNRDVRMCHPPSSVDIVEQIISDFKAGKADSAPFWIQLNGRFIHIEYFALRNDGGDYLGTIEVSQDLTELRKLEGEQRLLSYRKE
ncbi:DUF438 domain-containing protein [candidate division KSB1 bacterium]|nr:DUF438 domain-containing protein [candidate division KSB1 bacterium]RQW02355.1 MAG: DUF438 domain-containing protein [candidate division KSB1 bacterium]